MSKEGDDDGDAGEAKSKQLMRVEMKSYARVWG